MADFISGKSRLIGRSTIYSTPIGLDPAAFEGAMVGGDNGVPYYSNGTEWVATVDSARTSQIVTAALTVGGTANAVTITTGLNLIALSTGFRFWFIPTAANTGASTINVDGHGAAAVKTVGSRADTPANYFRTGIVTEVVWDGTNFIADRETEIVSNSNGTAALFANGSAYVTRTVVITTFNSAGFLRFDAAIALENTPDPIVSASMPISESAQNLQNLGALKHVGTSSNIASGWAVYSDGSGVNAAFSEDNTVYLSALGAWYPGGVLA